MSITSDKGFLVLLTVHLVRCQPVIEKAVSILDPSDFDPVGERSFALLWSISREWFREHGKPIPKAYMEIELTKRFTENFGEFTADGVNEVIDLLNHIYGAPDDVLVPHAILRQMQLFLDDRRLRPMVSALSTATVGGDFDKLMQEFDERRRASRVSSTSSNLNIFTSKGITFKNTTRTRTGVKFVDDVLGGGTAIGEVYGLLGPTGGGKTTTATMIAQKVAEARRNVALFSYETELVPQVSNKIYGAVGNIPREVLKNIKTVDDLPARYREQLESQLDLYGSYIKPFDMKCDAIHGVGGGGIPELRTMLRRCHDDGEHVELIIIDQLLSLVDSQILAENRDLRFRRQYMQLAIEQLRELVQSSDMNCSAIVLHQVDNAVKQASPLRAPRKGDAAEDKSFDNNLHFCMQFGVMDSEGRCYFGTPKAREAEEELLILQIDREYWRFNYTKDKFVATPQGFVPRDASDDHAVPSQTEIDRSTPRTDTLDDAEIV